TNLTLTLIPAGPYPRGVTPVWLRVTDTGGLKDSCNATVTVNDVTPPVIACPGKDSVECQSAVPAAATNLAGFVAQGGTASDNCGAPTITFQGDVASGSCPRTITRTYRATDGSGNFAECTQTIIVHDVTKPTITSCPKDTVVTIGALDPLPAVTFTVTASDNCGVDHITTNPASGSTFAEGVTTVKSVAVDSCGNKSDTCHFTVTVNRQSQKVPPVAKCKDVTVNANASCQANASIDDGSNDPDGGPVTLVQTPAGPYSLGTTKVTLHVTDDEGDTASCQANVTVEDHTPPSVVCTGDITVANDPGQCGASVGWPAPQVSDNCSGAQAVCVPELPIQKSGESLTFFPIGKTKVQCIATDGSGNKDTCEFFITVNDTTKPQIVCPQDIKVANDPNECGAVVSWTDPIPTDNCPNVKAICKPASGSFFNVGPTTVWCVATDASGNKDSCSFTVTVNDTEKPKITCPNDLVLDNDPGQCGRLVTLGGGEVASDNCPGYTVNCFLDNKAVTTPGIFLPVGDTYIDCMVTDASGNTDQCQYKITIRDVEPPVIQCPADIVVIVGVSEIGAPVTLPAATATDNCPGVTIKCDSASGAFFNVGTTEVCCTATDASGNKDTCCFKVSVENFFIEPETSVGNWLSTDRMFGTANSFFDVFVDVSGLPPGTYDGVVYIADGMMMKAGTLSPVGGGAILATPDTLRFNANVDGPNPPKDSVYVYLDPAKSSSQSSGIQIFDSVIVILTLHQVKTPTIEASVDSLCFNILANKNDTLCKYFELTMTDGSEKPWCYYLVHPENAAFIPVVDPTGGTTPSKVHVCVDPCELEPGQYIDTILFCPWLCINGAEKDARIIPCAAVIVCLNVVNSPHLMINKTGFVFHVPYCEPVDPQKLGISNLDGGDLVWSTRISSCDPPAPADWLIIDPSSGVGDAEVDLKVDCTHLPPPQGKCDTLCASIEVSALCARWSPQYALCTLIVCPPPPPPCRICGSVLSSVPTKSGEPSPLEGACVQVWTSYPDGELIGTDTTDEKGLFCILGLDPDKTYDLRVYAKGYCPEILKGVRCGDVLFTITLSPIPFVDKHGWPLFADYYSQDAKTFGVPLQVGDVILALDPDGVYCGVAIVGELTGLDGDYLIHVLGDDPKTAEDEGAKEGDKITFLLNCVCPEVAPDTWSNQVSYKFDVDFRCNHKKECCDLCYPWNLISFNVIPDDDSLPAVLDSIDGKYERVYTSTCKDGPLSWQSGRPLNDLNNMGPYLGYGLRVTESGLRLCIEGTAIPVNTPVSLCTGWNFIPYYPEAPDNLDHALASIAGEYIHIFGMECEEPLSWHENRTVNDLECLRPCLGYFIKMKKAAFLVYPAAGYECVTDDTGIASGKISGSHSGLLNPTMRFTDFWSPMNPAQSELVQGDQLTVKTQSGVICGECTVGAGGAFLVHVFGDDPVTAIVEGARDGELLQFEVNGVPAQVTDGSAFWNERESSRLTITPATASPVPADYALLQNYPNPFNAGTVIPFALKNGSQWTLTVYNVVGQAIRTFQGTDAAGVVRVAWDGTADGGSTVPSGIYFYRVRTPEWTDAKKMTLLK
ncbi:MAG: HYR domain-containing protein, partial [candidate division Zixibacteria bacterium]|nr:HYR domain-containing protein [candidate division Zixibacteria bacterium]